MSVCTFIASNGPLTAVDDRAEQILRYIKAALKETEVVEFWNKPDKQLPSRPSFYCLRIER